MIETGFLLKKVIAAWCMPLPLAACLLLVACLFQIARRKRLAKLFAGLSLIFVYSVSIEPTADLLARQLEDQYPAYPELNVPPADYILVLGSGHVSDPTRPITSFLTGPALKRLLEGIRIYRLQPEATLLFSGYPGKDAMSHARAQKKVASYFGVPEHDMQLAEEVRDTAEEAWHWVDWVQNKRLVLVTSATHMPRAMYLFEQAAKQLGWTPHIYPAPTDYISYQETYYSWKSWFPSGQYLDRVERSWHEYLGLLWAKLRA